eukprot:s5169_g6.t1
MLAQKALNCTTRSNAGYVDWMRGSSRTGQHVQLSGDILASIESYGLEPQVVNYFLLPRGPDGTQTLRKGPFVFVHNLLHMTGERVWQPFVVAVYNGEIYNARQVPQGFEDRHLYRSDGECLLPAYLHLGPRFPQTLDGV